MGHAFLSFSWNTLNGFCLSVVDDGLCTSVVKIPMVGCCAGKAREEEGMSVIILRQGGFDSVMLELQPKRPWLAVECYFTNEYE